MSGGGNNAGARTALPFVNPVLGGSGQPTWNTPAPQPAGGIAGNAPAGTPAYPNLYGGEWNQLAQMMAGPSYQAKPNPTLGNPYGNAPGSRGAPALSTIGGPPRSAGAAAQNPYSGYGVPNYLMSLRGTFL